MVVPKMLMDQLEQSLVMCLGQLVIILCLELEDLDLHPVAHPLHLCSL
jgi:hypothetical protein